MTTLPLGYALTPAARSALVDWIADVLASQRAFSGYSARELRERVETWPDERLVRYAERWADGGLAALDLGD